jgi:hypothetical protein
MEHRWGERLLVNLPVRVSAHAFSSRDGRLTDLSVSGARLSTQLDLRPCGRIAVHIVLPQRAVHDAPAVAGYIARRYRGSFGVEWCEFAPEAVCQLLRAAVHHPYTLQRHPVPAASLTRSRLSGALLRHAP